MGCRIDHQSGRAARQVAGRAAQQKVVMYSDGGAVRSARVERDDSGVLDRIVRALHRSWRVWIGNQQTAAAGNGSAELAVIATRGVIGNNRDRGVEALRLGIPGGLLDPQAKARR